MTGSDFPYFQDEKYTRAVTYVADLVDHGGDPARVRAIHTDNARALYGDRLPASARG